MRITRVCLAAAAIFVAMVPLAKAESLERSATITTFDRGAPTPPNAPPPGYPHGAQVVKLDEDGNALDAKADFIAYFNDRYYLYGESYDCTYDYSSFCGFRVYESKNLVNWTSRGRFIDPATSDFARETCKTTISCWGPNVLYNKATGKYVLWFYRAIGSAPDRLRVMEGDSPTGPWVNPTTPTGLPKDCHCAFHLYQEPDGTAYVSYTTGAFGLGVQKLNASYTDAVGDPVTVTKPSGSIASPHCQPAGGLTGPDFQNQTPAVRVAWKSCGLVEAPSILRKGDRYYMTFSDPICAFCLGTATSYFVADDPLGPWKGRNGSPSLDPDNPGKFDAFLLSPDSCGGQPFHTANLPNAQGDRIDLFVSVLWTNSRNNGAANHNWEPLEFRNGLIKPLRCGPTSKVPLARPVPDEPEPPKALNVCAARAGSSLTQTLTAPATGRVRSLELPLYQKTRPARVFGTEGLTSDALELELRNQESGASSVKSFTPQEVSWSPTRVGVDVDVAVRRGDRLTLTLRSTTPQGCYETLYETGSPYARGRLRGEGDAEPIVASSGDLLFTALVRNARGVIAFGS